MSPQDYQKLNIFLNNFFLYMDKKDPNFNMYIYPLAVMSDEIKQNFSGRFVSNNSVVHLTFMDVFNLAREIIEKINPDYLKEFDKVLDSGILDFSYDHAYESSMFRSFYKDGQVFNEININRYYNYSDVATLVHEFIHYTAHDKPLTYNYMFLIEFFSIYFQEYAKRYLMIEKGASESEVSLNERILGLLSLNDQFNKFGIVFFTYSEIGSINSDSKHDLDKLLHIEDEAFEEECKELLNIVNQKGEEEAIKYFSSQYQYIIGTILAYYALKNCEIKDIVNLNDSINTAEYSKMSIGEVLETVGIEMNVDTLEEAIDFMKSSYYDEQEKSIA